MHIPDGFLDTKTAIATALLSTAAVGVSLRRLHRTLPRRKVPLMGLTAAFVFAAQMVNFPVAGGTSGHLMGGMLAAVLLGPAAGTVVLAAVLIVQCFLFADGGVLALGANIFNMGVIGTIGGFGVYRATWRLVRGERGRFLAIAMGAWCSTLFAAVCCAGELAWSGTVGLEAAFTAMVNVHMFIAVGEAVITVLVLSAIRASRPDLMNGGGWTDGDTGTLAHVITYGAVAVVGIALFVAPFASPLPDGLEVVAASLGFDRSALPRSLVSAPMEGYALPGVGSPVAATAIAGGIGTVLMLLVGWLLARIAVPGEKPTPSPRRRQKGAQ